MESILSACLSRISDRFLRKKNAQMIVIASNTVNREGWRLLVEGINLEPYKKNPILLFQHYRPRQWESKSEAKLPVGKIKNLRVENGQLVADDPIFDPNDDFAMKLKSKFDGGFINAFSPGLDPITISDDPAHLMKGQTRATLVKSELIEISIVDIPGHADSVRLSNADDNTKVIPLISESEENKETMDFEKIALALGLDAKAEEQDILSAIQNLKKVNVEAVLSLGRQKGVVTDENQDHYEKLAKADLEGLKGLFLSYPDPKPEVEPSEENATIQNLLKLAKSQNGGGKEVEKSKEDWDFDTWSKKDPEGLLALKKDDPEKYQALADAYVNA